MSVDPHRFLVLHHAVLQAPLDGRQRCGRRQSHPQAGQRQPTESPRRVQLRAARQPRMQGGERAELQHQLEGELNVMGRDGS